VVYYVCKIKKGDKKMKELWYENLETGEIISGPDAHKNAMEWYRAGAEIALVSYSEVSGEWIERGRWVH
jgi:hypothetical protein